MTTVLTPERRSFAGAGVEIVGDVVGDPGDPAVVLLHGGGQTRHSWSAAAVELARRGHHAVSIDLRGHGDSGWSPDGDYAISHFRDDVLALIDQLPGRPVLVGASLGGIASLLAIGESMGRPVARGLVLVDITPRMEARGVDKIRQFMTARPEGYETLEQVADAVSAYNPSRPRPRNPSGLLKNLRLRDGRYFWHWDPAFMANADMRPADMLGRLDTAAANVRVPTLLVRGAESNIVSAETAGHLLELIPHADMADISGAGHMVAGDKNDAFNAAILAFFDRRGL